VTEPQTTLVRIDAQLLLQKAVEGNANIETIERLVALAKDVRGEQAREAWHEAMAEFQRRCPSIKKTSHAEIVTARGFYSYSYAPLDQIMETIRPLLGELGLSVSWSSTKIDPQRITMSCQISHVLGHKESSGEISMPIPDASERGGGNTAQRVGSALTYARRYSLLQVTGLAPEDDDDAGSTGKAGAEKQDGEPVPPKEAPSVVFPIGKHKDMTPSSLTLDDLQRERAFWSKKVDEATKPAYKASNQKILDAIKEAIAEKTAKPQGPPEGSDEARELHDMKTEGTLVASVDVWRDTYEGIQTVEQFKEIEACLSEAWKHYDNEEKVALKMIRDRTKSRLPQQ
jgi:hypothetical protein